MAVLTGSYVPFMASVTATTSAQTLYALLSAIRTNLPAKASFVQLQLDPGAGGTALYIGNSDVSSVLNGASLLGGQAQQTFAFDSNLIVLAHIYLLASTGTCQVNVCVVVR